MKMLSNLDQVIVIWMFLCISWVLANENCTDEFLGLQNECECRFSGTGREAWCPSTIKTTINFVRSSSELKIVCHSIDEINLRFFVNNLTLPNSVLNVLFFNCPIPSTSYADLISGMNVSGIKALYISNGISEDKRLIRGQFDGLGDTLERLVLKSNNFETVDADAFQNLSKLNMLKLQNNAMQQFPAGVFQSLNSLVDLEIEQINVKELPTDLFVPLTKLEFIKLRTKSNLTQDTFKSNVQLKDVQILDLDASQLSDQWSPFQHLPDLRNVTLRGQGFGYLPKNLFDMNSKLENFVWTYDKCLKTEKNCEYVLQPIVQNLTMLKTFKIEKSMAKKVTLTEDFFLGCSSLEKVIINKAKMLTLPESLFKGALKIEEIDFRYNYISVLPSKLIHPLPKLKRLFLTLNDIKSLDDEHFKFSQNLEVLKVDQNLIETISVNSLRHLVGLKELDLSSNKIHFDDDSVPKFEYLNQIETMNLSNNELSIHDIPQSISFSLPKLTSIDFSRNNIGPILNVSDLNFVQSKNLFVNLASNNITHFSYEVPASENKASKKVPKVTVDISKNPLTCDCRNAELALHLQNQLQDHEAIDWFKFKESAIVTCGASNQSLSEINLETMKCAFPSDFLNVPCSNYCQCEIAPIESPLVEEAHVILECNEYPNVIPDLKSHFNVKDVTLNLKDANLTSMKGLQSIENYETVSRLILSQNKLKEIIVEELPSNLRQLAIDKNEITKIDVQILQNRNLYKMWLSDNPYKCDCDSEDIFYAVQKNSDFIIQDAKNVTLRCDEGPKKVIDIKDFDNICVETKQVVLEIALPVSFFILLILIGAVVFLLRKETIYIWIYSKPYLRGLIFSSDNNSDKPYDVFISYSIEDADFVQKHLVPILEDKKSDYSYQCLINIRDFVPGRPIMDQIFEAVDASKCTLIILSKYFVQSEWAKHEFEVAQKRSRIIVMVYGELPNREDIPEGLFDYIRTSTYLEWGEKWFWKKLRYALPHKHENSNCCSNWCQQRSTKHDQLQLIHTRRNGSINSNQLGVDAEISSTTNSFASIVNGRSNSVSPI